ncbi:MAG: methionine adenosyltransferase [Elusimicrobia bacterium RIFCSPLOWO2_02_FULL_39_32]|nr:MAG: methionine adenosyltransferase [Elusimicrobia bacterium RIFCSPHIGHO2_02_FULL_39_36]OGR93225.1 MAG: methionine adenosyltransferase [Elusimicrobia bacterium RIFCSPLOWO2_02_FULL_39_32]OGR99450.1 MAG: methionine adenosyltransferase [Elusimicrobia bacterium RIFCSPLOWO2_12_FULL_39_28]
MSKGKYFFTSESVTEGHPDKVCDQLSDAVLDEVLKQDPIGRVACESFITVGLVIVGGEITTKGYVEIGELVRQTIKDIGYNHSKYGFNYETCAVLNAIGRQSPDISQGVDTGGAGDQGLMIGYACDETEELMPLAITLAHRLTRRLAFVRKKKILPFLGPDGKSQVTVEYDDHKAMRVDTIVVSSQHTDEILDRSGKKITEKAREEIIKEVIKPVIPKALIDNKTKYFVNPTGKFVVGGPQSDTGMTGRKLIVDTYGGWAAHGGGAFSGKDPTKVDRSACYMARYIAKNIVASKLATQCTVQLAYAIGVADPVSVMIDTHGTGKINSEILTKLVKEIFPLTPRGIIEYLRLRRPIYKLTASYGHFGRTEPEFTWEKTDKADQLKREASRLA